MNEERKGKWTSYDIERPEKLLAIFWIVFVLALIVYGLLIK